MYARSITPVKICVTKYSFFELCPVEVDTWEMYTA